MTAGHLTTSKEKTEFAAQDENGLSCAVEAVETRDSDLFDLYKLIK